jgi:CspA family cold shock protein
MTKGIVKWFNEEKNYGFITPDDPNEKEIFFHKSAIKNLEENIDKGQLVEYSEKITDKGAQAVDITILNESS